MQTVTASRGRSRARSSMRSARGAVAVDEAARSDRVDAHARGQREGIADGVAAGEDGGVRGAGDAEVEDAREDVGHGLGEEAVARQLAADHGIEAGRAVGCVIDDLVLAGERVLGGAEGVEGGADAGVGADGARLVDGGEDAGDAFDEVAHLFARGVDAVEVAVEVVVGGAEDGHVLPRLEEDLPPVDGAGEDGVVGEPPVVHDVDALARAAPARARARGRRARR